MNTHNTMALAAGIVVVLIVIALIIGYYVSELIEFWDAKRNPPGPDAGVDIVDCGMVADVPTDAEWKAMYDEHFPGVCGVCDGCANCKCDGCDECRPSAEYLDAMWRAS